MRCWRERKHTYTALQVTHVKVWVCADVCVEKRAWFLICVLGSDHTNLRVRFSLFRRKRRGEHAGADETEVELAVPSTTKAHKSAKKAADADGECYHAYCLVRIHMLPSRPALCSCVCSEHQRGRRLGREVDP